MRIALIHALKHSPGPIASAFAKHWPEAQLQNLLDDSLSADLAQEGKITPAMVRRFVSLGRYVADAGADAILFTCSAFGPCIEACADDLAPMPVLKPNEAMIEAANSTRGCIALIATFAPTLSSMLPEFPSHKTVVPLHAKGALDALDNGYAEEHDRLIVQAALKLEDCATIALAQFSSARAADAVARATGKLVLTTPDSAVHKLRILLSR